MVEYASRLYRLLTRPIAIVYTITADSIKKSVSNYVMRASYLSSTPIKLLLVYVVLLLLFSPLYVHMVRITQFDTISRDSYENMLLSLVGQHEPFWGPAPFGYRILNTAVALPFYPVPLFQFRKITDTFSPLQLKALQALMLATYCSMIALALLFAYRAKKHYMLSATTVLISGGVSLLFTAYSGWHSLDIPVIVYIALVYWSLKKPPLAATLLLISPFFNEKVFIIYSLFFGLRTLFISHQRRENLPCLIVSLVAAGIYYGYTEVVGLDFPSHQQDVLRYPRSLWHNITTFATVRGIFLNIIPLAILSIVARLFHLQIAHYRKHPQPSVHTRIYGNIAPHPCDTLVIPLFLLIIMAVTEQYSIGRIIVMLYPLYLLPALQFVDNHGYRLALARTHQ